MQKSSGSTPSSLWMAQLLTLSPRLSPVTQPLVSMISSFRSLPKSRDHRWGLEQRWSNKLKAWPSGSAPYLSQRTRAAPSLQLTKPQSVCPSHAPTCHHLWKRYLNSSAISRDSSPTRREHSSFFRLRAMASDMEELTLIQTASHSYANRSSVHWRSWLEEANRNTSSAKSRDATLRFPNQMPKEDLWQGAALADSSTHHKHVQLSARNVDTALTLVIHGPDNSGTPSAAPTESLGEHSRSHFVFIVWNRFLPKLLSLFIVISIV